MNLKIDWRHLIVENPMLIEVTRFRRKFLSLNSPMNSLMLSMCLIGYLSLMAMMFRLDGDIPPLPIILFQLGVITLITPSLLHNAIAGERERRSWDFLLVAPLTKAQIVVGKFMGALAAQGFVTVLFLLPTIYAAITYRPPIGTSLQIDILVLAELISVSFGIFVAALAMLFSARSKRAFTALGTTLGVLSIGIVVGPMFVGILGANGIESQMLLVFHPFVAIFSMQSFASADYNSQNLYLPRFAYGLPQIAVYLLLAVVLIAWTINTLVFAENEVKFMPTRKDNHA